MFHERCKTTIISLLYSSHSALNLVKFIKIAFFVINLCKKDCNSMMHTWQQTIDQSWKQPRPILQDRDHKSQHQERKIPVSRPRPRSRGLHLRKFAKHTNNVYFGIQQRFFPFLLPAAKSSLHHWTDDLAILLTLLISALAVWTEPEI